MYCQSTADVVVNTAILVASPEPRMQCGMATSGVDLGGRDLLPSEDALPILGLHNLRVDEPVADKI